MQKNKTSLICAKIGNKKSISQSSFICPMGNKYSQHFCVYSNDSLLLRSTDAFVKFKIRSVWQHITATMTKKKILLSSLVSCFFKAKHTTFSGTRDLMIAPTSQTKTSLCNIHSKLKKRKESGIKTTKLSDQTVKLGISDQICINILLLLSQRGCKLALVT